MMNFEYWSCGNCSGLVCVDGYTVHAYGCGNCEECSSHSCPVVANGGADFVPGWDAAEPLMEWHCSAEDRARNLEAALAAQEEGLAELLTA